MRHLSDETLVDALDGRADGSSREHLAQCETCAQKLAEAEAGLALAHRSEVPEPSPLYWSALRHNVGRRIAEEPRSASRLGWFVPVAAAAALLAVAMGRSPAPAPPPAVSPRGVAALPAWSALPPIDEDEAVPLLQGVLASVGSGWDEGRGADAYLASLSEADSSALVETLAARPGGQDGKKL
jgi:hypothetical protein